MRPRQHRIAIAADEEHHGRKRSHTSRGKRATPRYFDCQEEQARTPAPGLTGTKDGFRQLAEMVVAAFSDRKAELDEYLDTSDGRVVESWAMTGTHTGEAFGLPASGQDIRVRGIEIWRCAGGKVVEHWGAVDMSDLFMKAGPASA